MECSTPIFVPLRHILLGISLPQTLEDFQDGIHLKMSLLPNDGRSLFA